MLSLGRSKSWQAALGVMTGEPEGRLDTSAMLEYFRPLEEWLTRDNAEHGEHVGWHSGKGGTRASCAHDRYH